MGRPPKIDGERAADGRVRTQLYLEEGRKRALARYAFERDMTISAVMEEALDRMGVFAESAEGKGKR